MLSCALNHSEVWEGALCCKETETERQTICPESDCVGPEETHILLAERYLSIRGENSVIRNTHTWMKLPHWVFSISLLLSFSLSFVLVPYWCIPSLIWRWKREATENLVERVFMVDSVVRWLSQRRMLIRQPRLRLIWLAAVTPSSCSQSVPRLFPPRHCSTASFLSLFLFWFSYPFSSFHLQDHLFILWARLSCAWSHGRFCNSHSPLEESSHIKKMSSDCSRLTDLKGFLSFHRGDIVP